MSICLSVASNLRCSNLSLSQAQALLVLPATDLLFCAGIVKLNWGDIKHHQWAIIVEAIVYFCLTLFDYLERAKAKNGLDTASFATYDKAIGVLTMFPLFFYCAAVLLLARTDVLPLTTSRLYKRLILVSLVAITPLILLFNELASLIGITYELQGGRIYLGFVSPQAKFTSSALTGTTLILLAYFQFIIGIACIFYIVHARARGHGGGVILGFTCCGSGLLLGTLETLMGFGHQGFPLILTRKIFRTMARALTISGMLVGTGVDMGFALYPSKPRRPSTSERRGSSGLRALISNPRASTFAHLSPRATTFHHNHSASRLQSSLGRSNSSSSTGHLMASDPRLPIENIAPPQHPGAGPVSPGLVLSVPQSVADRILRKQKRRQTDGIYFSYAAAPSMTGTSRKIRPGFNPFEADDMARFPVRANKPGDRVTIQFPNGDYTKAPVLQLRLSDLQLPSPATVAAGLRTLGDAHVAPNRPVTYAGGGGSGLANTMRMKGLPARPREVSFSDTSGSKSKTPREMGVRLPSRPLSARLSQRWSSLTGSRTSPGGSWVVLSDEKDEKELAKGIMPLEPPQPAFVSQAEGRSSTPRSSRSRISEGESVWLRGVTLPPPVKSPAEQRFSQPRSTWYSEDGYAATPRTPQFAARIVEARAVTLRPHWSTTHIYHSQVQLPEGEEERQGPSRSSVGSNVVPFPIAPSPLKQLASRAQQKEAQFEEDFQNGLTRQLHVGERRVSRQPPVEDDDDEIAYQSPDDEEPVARPRLSDRAVDVESRRRSPKHSHSPSDESHDALRRMSHRFKSLQSVEEAATTVGHSVGSTEEVRSLVRGYGTVVARRPTVLSGTSRETKSVTLEHGMLVASPSTTLQQVFGQRYSFDGQSPIPESPEGGGLGEGRMGRSDSGVFGRDRSL